jgi:ABC-type branched-subunit amino acid transport system ATPase component
MLKIDHVSASIAGNTVLRGVSTEFNAGQLLAVVGRNGAGKTTLLRAIMGLLPLSAGTIAMNGEDLSRVPAHRRTSLGIGYAPEDRVTRVALRVDCPDSHSTLMLLRSRINSRVACFVTPFSQY